LQELRRGLNQAGIYSLTFSTGAHWLCVSSDSGTAHVFSLECPAPDPVMGANVTHRIMGARERSNTGPGNPKSWLTGISGVLPAYFASEWSYARYRGASRALPDCRQLHATDIVCHAGISVPSICSFGPSSGPSEVPCEPHVPGSRVSGQRRMAGSDSHHDVQVTTLIVVGADCTLHKCSFPGEGGDCESTFATTFLRSQK